jgi:hypothetical protein
VDGESPGAACHPGVQVPPPPWQDVCASSAVVAVPEYQVVTAVTPATVTVHVPRESADEHVAGVVPTTIAQLASCAASSAALRFWYSVQL